MRRFSVCGATPAAVHMALLDGGGNVAVLSLDCPDGRFPSVGARHAPAIRLERAIRDLYGLEPVGAPDTRPWLDHGRWGVEPSARRAHGRRRQPPPPYRVPRQRRRGPAPDSGRSGACRHHRARSFPLHRQWRDGRAAGRAARLCPQGHRGADAPAPDSPQAARLAGRVSGDSTVAYALAFARAVEAATGVEAPPRAPYLRALMAELERVANHLGDIGAICNDAAFALMQAHCARAARARAALRRRRLRSSADDGLRRSRRRRGRPAPRRRRRARARWSARSAGAFPRLVELYDHTASLQDRTVGTGILKAELARAIRAPAATSAAPRAGPSTRARRCPIAPYDALDFDVPVRAGGRRQRAGLDPDRRGRAEPVAGRADPGAPAGRAADAPTSRPAAGEGLALVEGFRGDVLAWVRLGDDGRVARCHLRDPSWFQWPLLEAVIEGNIVADFPLCNKSFNCSYSGHDL